MLPVDLTTRQAAWWVFLHTASSSVVGFLLVVTPALGWGYFLPVIGATYVLLVRNIRLIRYPAPRQAPALSITSSIYLAVLLWAIILSTLLDNAWPTL